MNKYKVLLKDTLLFAISNFGSKILSLLLIPLYVNVLSTEEYGTVDIITTTVNLILPLLSLSVSSATLRFALDRDCDNDSVLGNSLMLTMLSVAVVLIILPIVNVFLAINTEMLFFFTLIYFLSGLHICLANFIKGSNNTKLFAIQGVIQTAVLLTCNLFFLLVLKIGVRGYLLSIVLSYVVAVTFMIVFGRIYKCRFMKTDKDMMKNMLIYCIPLVPGTVAWWINTSVDKYMIIGMYGIGQSGIYSIAHKVPTLLTMVTNIFLQAWQIAAINNYKENGSEDFYNGVYSYFSLLNLVIGIFLIFTAQLIAKIAFSAEYYEAWKFMPFLVVSSIFSSHASFLASVFSAAKKTKMLLNSVCVGAAVNFVLNYVLLKIFGTVGAAIATMISFGVMWVIRLGTVQNVLHISYSKGQMIVSHLLIILGATAISFELGGRYILLSVSAAIILWLYRKDIGKAFAEIENVLLLRKSNKKI